MSAGVRRISWFIQSSSFRFVLLSHWCICDEASDPPDGVSEHGDPGLAMKGLAAEITWTDGDSSVHQCCPLLTDHLRRSSQSDARLFRVMRSMSATEALMLTRMLESQWCMSSTFTRTRSLTCCYRWDSTQQERRNKAKGGESKHHCSLERGCHTCHVCHTCQRSGASARETE